MARKLELEKAAGTDMKDKSFKNQRRGSSYGKRPSVLRTNANNNETLDDQMKQLAAEHG